MSFSKYDGQSGMCLLEVSLSVSSGFTPTVWFNMKPLNGKTPTTQGGMGIPLNFNDVMCLIQHLDNPSTNVSLNKQTKNGTYLVQRNNNDIVASDGNKTLLVTMNPGEIAGLRTYLYGCWSYAGIVKDIVDNVSQKTADLLTVFAEKTGQNINIRPYDKPGQNSGGRGGYNNNYRSQQQPPQSFQQNQNQSQPLQSFQQNPPQQPSQNNNTQPPTGTMPPMGLPNMPQPQNFRPVAENTQGQDAIPNASPVSGEVPDSSDSNAFGDQLRGLFMNN